MPSGTVAAYFYFLENDSWSERDLTAFVNYQ
jgi:hypothetical protein